MTRTCRFLANFVEFSANFGVTGTHFYQSASQFEYNPNLPMFSRKCQATFEKQANLENMNTDSSC